MKFYEMKSEDGKMDLAFKLDAITRMTKTGTECKVYLQDGQYFEVNEVVYQDIIQQLGSVHRQMEPKEYKYVPTKWSIQGYFGQSTKRATQKEKLIIKSLNTSYLSGKKFSPEELKLLESLKASFLKREEKAKRDSSAQSKRNQERLRASQPKVVPILRKQEQES